MSSKQDKTVTIRIELLHKNIEYSNIGRLYRNIGHRMILADFAINIRKMIEGDNKLTSSPLVVGKPSEILSRCGANIEQDITITKKVIDKAMRPEVRDKEGRMVGNTVMD